MRSEMVDVRTFLLDALECSIYLRPADHGLSHEELIEAGATLGFRPGELRDALAHIARPMSLGQTRFRLPRTGGSELTTFHMENDPEYRDVKAFDFVHKHLLDLGREVGRTNARVPKDVLIANGVAAGLAEHNLAVAIALCLHEADFLEQDALISYAHGKQLHVLPSAQVGQRGRAFVKKRPSLRTTYEAVKNVIERRTDGRPTSAEPLRAFEAALDGLGHGRFRTWWARGTAELHVTNLSIAPLTVCVLAAALAEGALTFVVGHARKLNLNTLNSKTFGESPNRWKFDELLKSAAAGGADAIFDDLTRQRADRLNTIRQRIHAGRLLAEIPVGPIPDTRPEEAREARESLDAIVRRIIDWLAAHPLP